MKIILTVRSQTVHSHLHFSIAQIIVILPSLKRMNFFLKLYEFVDYTLQPDYFPHVHVHCLSLLDFEGSGMHLTLKSKVKLHVAIQFLTRLMKVKETSLIRIKAIGITSSEHNSDLDFAGFDFVELFQVYHLFKSRQNPFHLG